MVEGDFHPMVANDGPHYGDNVKPLSPRQVPTDLHKILPPGSGHTMFGRHTDKETGVAPWFEGCELNYDYLRRHRRGLLMGRAGRSRCSACCLAGRACGSVHAALPTYELTIRDGHFEPAAIEVPARQRFKIIVHNAGGGPTGVRAHRCASKVLSPGVTSLRRDPSV